MKLMRFVDKYITPTMDQMDSNISEMKSNRDIQGLFDIMHHKDYLYRSKAVEALANLGELDLIIEVLKNGKDPDTRCSMSSGLRFCINNDIEKEKALGALIFSLLNDKDEVVRKSMAFQLGNYQSLSALDPLLDALKDPSYLVRKSVVEALGNLGDKKAVEPLIKVLSDGNEELAIFATYALGKLNDDRAVKPLIYSIRPSYKDRAFIDNFKDMFKKNSWSIWDNIDKHDFSTITERFFNIEEGSNYCPDDEDLLLFSNLVSHFNPAERHGAWILLAQKFHEKGIEKNETDWKDYARKCYIEALYNDPDPASVAWMWLNGDIDPYMDVLSRARMLFGNINPGIVKWLKEEYGLKLT